MNATPPPDAGVVFLAIALVGSLLFVAYAVNVRDDSADPVRAGGWALSGSPSSGAPLRIHCGPSGGAGGIDGRDGWAIGLAILGGGIAAIIGRLLLAR